MNKLNVYTGDEPKKELRNLDIEIQRICNSLTALEGKTITDSGWYVNPGYTENKIFDPEITTLTQVARVLGTLIDKLKANGFLAA